MKYRGLDERLLYNSFLDAKTGCWVWLGRLSHLGYGWINLRVSGRRSPVPRKAHRISYEVFKGKKITEGLEIDHLCRNRRCINPDHLEEVTGAVNLARRDAA